MFLFTDELSAFEQVQKLYIVRKINKLAYMSVVMKGQ